MFVLLRSSEFDTWLLALKDAKAKARILARLRSASQGNFGDCASVSDGVFEMRVHVGPGYRVYYMQRDKMIYLLLTGGDKSTQKKDIVRAKEMAQAVKENEP